MDGWSFEYNIDVDVAGRIVYEKIHGVWRVTTANDFVADYAEEVAAIIKKPWVRYCDLTGWKTATPDVIDVIAEQLRWCKDHNLVWSVNVIDNPVTYGQLQKMFDRGTTKDISKTFRTRPEAVRFLKSEGFEVRSTPRDM